MAISDIPEISLVIPCYNEEGNLRQLVKAIRAAVEGAEIAFLVVTRDDKANFGNVGGWH